jgi:hypothetical protein
MTRRQAKPQSELGQPIEVMIVSEGSDSRFYAMKDRSRFDFPRKHISIIERRDLSKTFTLNWQTHEYTVGPPLTMKAKLDITTSNSVPEPSPNDWPFRAADLSLFELPEGFTEKR